jgi:hypothetical protein
VPKLGHHPSPSKVDKNDITGQSVRSTRLADLEKRVKAPEQRMSWVSGGRAEVESWSCKGGDAYLAEIGHQQKELIAQYPLKLL